MQLLVVFICLIALQFLHIPRAKLTHFFGSYIHLWVHFFANYRWFKSLGGIILLAIIPVLLLSLSETIYPLTVVLQIMVMLFCLSVCFELRPSLIDARQATPYASSLDVSLIPNALWQVNYYFVTPLFWYLILGSFGLIFYTCFLYASFCNLMPSWQEIAKRLVEQAAWIPCRITGLAYGFAGDLKPTLKIWGELVMTDSQANHVFLLSCAQAAHQGKTDSAANVTYAKLLRDAEILLLGLFAVLAMIKMLF